VWGRCVCGLGGCASAGEEVCLGGWVGGANGGGGGRKLQEMGVGPLHTWPGGCKSAHEEVCVSMGEGGGGRGTHCRAVRYVFQRGYSGVLTRCCCCCCPASQEHRRP
jgi:hypothetical protein